MNDIESMKHQPTSSRNTSSNSSDGSRGDGDTAPTDSAVDDSWFLEQTIRYHEERTRAFGVLRCELWLSRRCGTGIVVGSGREEVLAIPDVVYCWQLAPRDLRKTATTTTTTATTKNAIRKNSRKKNRHYHSKNQESSSSSLGERLANRLWSYHKDRSNPQILWRRFGTLTDNTEDPPTQRPRPPSSDNRSKGSLAPELAMNWIASIPFEVPAVAVVGGSNSRTIEISSNFRGMVCWLFETESASSSASSSASASVATTAMNHQSSDIDIPQSHPPSSSVESFLRSATDHIAATYSLESFKQLPLPQKRSRHESTSKGSAANPTTPENRRREKRMPPELCYNEDVVDDHSQNGRMKTMSSFEINDIRDATHDADDSSDDRSGHNCGKKKMLLAVRTYFRKYKGCGHSGPQPLCWRQTVFTFIGSYVTIYLIYCFNLYISSQEDGYVQSIVVTNATDRTRNDYDTSAEPLLQMGPFGASCVLIFAMTNAGPSQPRSMLVGITIGMIVGKLVGYLEAFGVGIGVRMSLATASTASIMARACVIFPPAGALALIFSSQLLGWDKFLLQIVGTALAVGLGVVINNIHPHRTYPTFWAGIEGCKEGNRKQETSCRSYL